jgi:hypothetical protein
VTDDKTRLDKFKEAAHNLETDDDKTRLDERVRKIVTHKPVPDKPVPDKLE